MSPTAGDRSRDGERRDDERRDGERAGRPQRLPRGRTVLGLLVLGALVVVTGAVVWTRAVVEGALAGAGVVEATGGAAAPLVPALGLVALAGAGAATTTRRAGSAVALGLVALAGAGVVAGAVGVLVDPLSATAAEVGEALGVTAGSVEPGSATATTTAWPWVAALLGVLLAVLAAAGAAASRRWPSGRRYEAPAAPGPGEDLPPAGDPAAERARRRGESFDAWDSLTRGEDPTGETATPVRPPPSAREDRPERR
ncbi:Trp biosynthesis-associated membrane protein [uncultured Pseudokineococcus sp.]|uniref:Trp biosynthesis-associated membrane protein n=1 Tax=uncultured Pseudokineococcus sp. TaxID=1642928 RepID=UPI00260AE445|nr:Trp biosynthesis-associated membrane protein [uncultured Pseudokineococcus sp.]